MDTELQLLWKTSYCGRSPHTNPIFDLKHRRKSPISHTVLAMAKRVLLCVNAGD